MQNKDESVRITLYASPKYLEFFDAWAKDMHLSRSAAFTVMIRDYMRMSEMTNQIADLNALADKAISAKGLELTEGTQ